jgi:transposase-like protein
MKKQRKHYTAEEKVAILRRHLLEKVPISELCDKQGLQPTVFYRWQKEFRNYRRRPRSPPRGDFSADERGPPLSWPSMARRPTHLKEHNGHVNPV